VYLNNSGRVYNIIESKSEYGGLSQMAKLIENPKYSVISMRISESERQKLATLINDKGMNITGVMREALEMYYSSLLANKHERVITNKQNH
jgi:hypothetical protein